MSGPVFVGGCARSGTTLLQLLLDRHSDLMMVFETLFPVRTRCDDLEWPLVQAANCADRIFPQLDPRTAARGLSREALALAIEEAAPESWADCCRAVIGFARNRQVSRWGMKSPFVQFYVDEILARFSNARVVLMVRDPRDTCASLMQLVPSLRQVDAAARWWRRCLEAAERAQRAYPSHVRLLRYEDLVRQPERELRAICDFVGIGFEPQMLDGEGPPAGVPEPPAGVFLSPKVTTERIGGGARVLGDFERLVVEMTLSDALWRLGYGLPRYLHGASARRLARLATDVVVRPTWPARHLASRFLVPSRARADRG